MEGKPNAILDPKNADAAEFLKTFSPMKIQITTVTNIVGDQTVSIWFTEEFFDGINGWYMVNLRLSFSFVTKTFAQKSRKNAGSDKIWFNFWTL